jgi:hypothetical protein
MLARAGALGAAGAVGQGWAARRAAIGLPLIGLIMLICLIMSNPTFPAPIR